MKSILITAALGLLSGCQTVTALPTARPGNGNGQITTELSDLLQSVGGSADVATLLQTLSAQGIGSGNEAANAENNKGEAAAGQGKAAAEQVQGEAAAGEAKGEAAAENNKEEVAVEQKEGEAAAGEGEGEGNEVGITGAFDTPVAVEGGDIKQDILYTKSTVGAFEFEFQNDVADEVTVTENNAPAPPPTGFEALEPNSFKVALVQSKGVGLTLSKIDFIFDTASAGLQGKDVTQAKVGRLCPEAGAFQISETLGELEFEAEENEVTLNLNKNVTAEAEWGIFIPVAGETAAAGAEGAAAKGEEGKAEAAEGEAAAAEGEKAAAVEGQAAAGAEGEKVAAAEGQQAAAGEGEIVAAEGEKAAAAGEAANTKATKEAQVAAKAAELAAKEEALAAQQTGAEKRKRR